MKTLTQPSLTFPVRTQTTHPSLKYIPLGGNHRPYQELFVHPSLTSPQDTLTFPLMNALLEIDLTPSDEPTAILRPLPDHTMWIGAVPLPPHHELLGTTRSVDQSLIIGDLLLVQVYLTPRAAVIIRDSNGYPITVEVHNPTILKHKYTNP